MIKVELVGGTMLMVSMVLIMYNDGWLEMVLLEIGMREDVWHDIVFVL